jgi:tetratricopeptide (TPR) repeat protein
MIDVMTKSLTTICAGVALLLWIESPAQAEEVQDALRLEANGQLIEALHTFELALRRRDNSLEDLVTIYEHLGVLQLAAGERGEARQSMDRLLAVDPSPNLPDTAPPEAQELLDEAIALWNGRRLHAEIEVPGSVRLKRPLDIRDEFLKRPIAGELVHAGRCQWRRLILERFNDLQESLGFGPGLADRI